MPGHQKILRFLGWLMAGFIALGTVLDAMSNAIALINWQIALAGTFLFFLGWTTIQIYLKRHPIQWKNESGSLIRVKKLGYRYSFFVVGMVILLWLPPSITWIRTEYPISYKIEVEREDEILIIITTFVRYEGVDDAKVQSELARAIEEVSTELDFLSIRVEVVPDEISSDQLDLAGKIGEKYDASFIVFGDQTAVRVNAYLLNLRLSTNRSSLGEEITYPLVNDEGYKLTAQLPAQIVYRLFFDIAETYFQNGENDEAISIALEAIDYSYNELSREELGTGYFFIGQIYEQQQNETQTERYYCSSRNYYPSLTSGMQLECIYPKRSQ